MARHQLVCRPPAGPEAPSTYGEGSAGRVGRSTIAFRKERLKGLSCLKGNFHEQFLGGLAGAIPPGYPAGDSDITSLPNQLVSLRSLPWVAWASLPHLPRYYAPLRLPPCPSRGASLVARFPIPCVLPSFVVSLTGSWPGGSSWSRQGLWS